MPMIAPTAGKPKANLIQNSVISRWKLLPSGCCRGGKVAHLHLDPDHRKPKGPCHEVQGKALRSSRANRRSNSPDTSLSAKCSNRVEPTTASSKIRLFD